MSFMATSISSETKSETRSESKEDQTDEEFYVSMLKKMLMAPAVDDFKSKNSESLAPSCADVKLTPSQVYRIIRSGSALFQEERKLRYPSRVFMLRGNHVDANTTLSYGFQEECIGKFGKREGFKRDVQSSSIGCKREQRQKDSSEDEKTRSIDDSDTSDNSWSEETSAKSMKEDEKEKKEEGKK